MDAGDILLLVAVGAVAYYLTQRQGSASVTTTRGVGDRSSSSSSGSGGSPSDVTRPEGRYARDIGAVGEGLGTLIGGIADLAS